MEMGLVFQIYSVLWRIVGFIKQTDSLKSKQYVPEP